jgi:DNA primase
MEVYLACPFCAKRGKGPDRKTHLAINPEKNVLHCFRCGFGSRNAKAVSARERLPLPPGLRWGTPHTAGAGELITAAPPVALPDGFSTDFDTADGRRAYHYLQSRGLPPALIYGYGIGYSMVPPFDGRIIVPIYQQGRLVAYQGRCFLGGNRPKYRTSAGFPPGTLFNIDRAQHAEIRFLVEGVFDAFAVPSASIALFGKHLTEPQRIALLRLPVRPLYIAVDADADADADDIARQLRGCMPVVRLPLPAGVKDLGESPAWYRQLLHQLSAPP